MPIKHVEIRTVQELFLHTIHVAARQACMLDTLFNVLHRDCNVLSAEQSNGKRATFIKIKTRTKFLIKRTEHRYVGGVKVLSMMFGVLTLHPL